MYLYVLKIFIYLLREIGRERNIDVGEIHVWAKQRVAGSIPSLGHMPGLWAKSPVGGACKRQPDIDVSFLSPL